MERYQLWRHGAAADTVKTSWGEGDVPFPRNQQHEDHGIITVRGYEKIMVLGYGTGADATTFLARFHGVMDNGPLVTLGQYTVKLGTHTDAYPLVTNQARHGMPVTGTGRFANTFTKAADPDNWETAPTGGGDTNAQVNETAYLIMPTHNFKHLAVELFSFTGLTAAGLLWRGYEATRIGAR